MYKKGDKKVEEAKFDELETNKKYNGYIVYVWALNPQEAKELAVQRLIQIGRVDCKIIKIKEA